MANLHQLLKAMIEKGGSDLHITTSSPPQLRIDGDEVSLLARLERADDVVEPECLGAAERAQVAVEVLPV